MNFLLVNEGNANLVFDTSLSCLEENSDENSQESNILLRVPKKFKKLSQNNTYTLETNYKYIQELINDSTFPVLHSLKPFFLEYHLKRLNVDDLELSTQKVLSDYFEIDQRHLYCLLMKNLIPRNVFDKTQTKALDYFTKMHFSSDFNEFVWECKPKWGYHRSFHMEASIQTDEHTELEEFCRNCCHNFKRCKTNKIGLICYSQLCEFQDSSVLMQCLDKENIPVELQTRIVDYFTQEDNIVCKIYQTQYNFLQQNGFHIQTKFDQNSVFYDPLLMLLRDVSCFIHFKADGTIEAKITDIDYKHDKRTKWEQDYHSLVETARQQGKYGGFIHEKT